MTENHASIPREWGRRDLLIRAGLIGALAAAGALSVPASAAAEPVVQPALDLLAYDTFAGISVFAVPGPDRYSIVQALTSPTPGGIEARAPELMEHTVDFFVSWPLEYLEALTQAFLDGAGNVPLPGGATLADLLRLALNDNALPASLVLALLFNLAATQVRPTAVLGPFPGSPFANLGHAEKAQACQRIEQADPDLVALIDAHLPEPLTKSASGLLRFAGGLVLTLSTFTAYTEFGVFDRATRTVTARPVGWDTSDYMPGRTTPADGWAEFLGYYQGRRAVSTAPEYGES
ncbi:hypothetical protein FHX82_003835 [Amycolatopsis bartoniae]|uniref:Gluconate 2-dehydrogenase subunit 3 family protein n=1 Tax=Amycolatopsis bartoniae TaxID=941986 RepID=A0A8H9ITN4_9PSEU|nr:hypothetical protein [Amycolatopsis bartoniae]MBB2936771.1 hypothetical protein [Amycolatopsis bartoniae]TVT09180.1 hypothetical protein FNH07_09790 [Amycolatopsis bartoniae]GHF50009.1 hypothetical protein GCM10017566_23860 [Amycolatopsis bartoniae]